MAHSQDLNDKIAYALEKLTQVQRILLWDMAKAESVSPIQIQILIFLQAHREELRTVSALAEEFDLTKATVSDAVSNLEDKGFIAKVRSTNDKRSSRLEPTAEGKKLLKRISSWQQVLLDNLEAFPAGKKEEFYSFLVSYIQKLFDNQVISVVRMCAMCENSRYDAATDSYTCHLTGRQFTRAGVHVDCGSFINSKNADEQVSGSTGGSRAKTK